MTRMYDLIKGIPPFVVELHGAFSPENKPNWMNGESFTFTCAVERTYGEAMAFAERETGKSDWLYNSPKYVDGKWVYILVR